MVAEHDDERFDVGQTRFQRLAFTAIPQRATEMIDDSTPSLPADLPEWLRPILKLVDQRQRAFDDLWPEVLRLRRIFFVDGGEAARTAMENAIRRAQIGRNELEEAIAAMVAATGIDREELDGTAPPPNGDHFPAVARATVMSVAPAAGTFVEDHLPDALALIESRAPKGWLERDPAELFRLPETDDGEPISIVKGVRLESERPKGHRLRQAIRLAQDHLHGDVRYDHFAGALAVTQLAQLGARADALRGVVGSGDRIQALFSGADPDATMFELLVAAACAEKGRDMSFIEATQDRSPDLRCNDKFSMVIECKRSKALSDYEVAEEALMRDLFRRLHASCLAREQFGRFDVELTVEAANVDLDAIASKGALQRLAAHPASPLEYPWGSVAFHELPGHIDLGGVTKAYSPAMLELAFGWDMETPEWDGLVCKVAHPPGGTIDVAGRPVALAWRVVAPEAVIKRSRAPIGLYGKAMTQIPRGEFGLVYVAYAEGARAEIADNRTKAIMDRIGDWEHDGGIRVPAAFLVRQYPIPTGHGNPGIVESTVRMLSRESGGDEWIFREYPSSIYTSR